MQVISLVASLITLVAGAAVLAAAAPDASPDSGRCGSVKLVLLNPDLQEGASGIIQASGLFFIQFQAVGPGAENVKSFTFSFGEALPDGTAQCTTPVWVTGAYILNYRGDYTPEDGFFVPINTTLVPDGDYGAAVHAYNAPNAQGTELGRFYVKAHVANGCQLPRCQDKTQTDLIKADKIMPWPRILPGDGIQTNKGVSGLSIEFAEPVKDVRAYINGNETPLTRWPGVELDDDAIPGNDNQPCSPVPAPACVKRVWGPALKWDGTVRQNDVIRVTAVDLNNNAVDKIIHLLDPSQGGIVSGDDINIDISVDNSTRQIGAGQEALYKFTFISTSSADAHVNLPVSYDNESLEAKFSPEHVVVKAGERATADLLVRPKDGVTSGTFILAAKPSWRSSGQDVVKEFPLSLIVGSGEGGNLVSTKEASNETAGAKGAGGTPGFEAIVGAVGLLGGLLAVRGRRSE